MMPSPEATLTFTDRLDTLEACFGEHVRGRRRWRRIACVALATLVLGVCVGGAAVRQNLMEARAFILRDDLGNMRGSFVISDDDGVRLTLFDTSRTAKAGVWLEPSGRASIWGFDNLPSAGTTPQTAAHTPAIMNGMNVQQGMYVQPGMPGMPGMQGMQGAQGMNVNYGVTPMMHTTAAPQGVNVPQFGGQPSMMNNHGTLNTAMPQNTGRPAHTVSYAAPAAPWQQSAGAPTGALIMLNSSARVIEKQHTRWTCGYQVTVRNDARHGVEQAYYVTFVDREGFVLARQARMIRLAPYQQTVLNGDIELSAERAAQIAHVRLSAWTP
jgi:hypothetical protein